MKLRPKIIIQNKIKIKIFYLNFRTVNVTGNSTDIGKLDLMIQFIPIFF